MQKFTIQFTFNLCNPHFAEFTITACGRRKIPVDVCAFFRMKISDFLLSQYSLFASLSQLTVYIKGVGEHNLRVRDLHYLLTFLYFV